MSTSTLHPLATAYLQQVRREGRDLPGDRLAELLIDLEEHLSAAIPADASDAGRPRGPGSSWRPARDHRGGAPRVDRSRRAPRHARVGGDLPASVRIHRRRRRLGRRCHSALALASLDDKRQAHRHACPSGWPVCDSAAPVAGSRATAQGNLHPPRTSATHYVTSVVHCTPVPSSGPSTLVSIALVLLALTPIATAVYLARRAR